MEPQAQDFSSDCAAQIRLLTIAVPTFNRANKLNRLLAELVRQIRTDGLEKEVCVAVGDNASGDNTTEVAMGYANTSVALDYYRHPRNLGFDGNFIELYALARSRFIWWVGDDDVPVGGAIKKVLDALTSSNPDVMLCSFAQPATSSARQFCYREPVHIVSDPVSCIDHIRRQVKISAHIHRKVNLGDEQWRLLRDHCGNEWQHFMLAFSVLACSSAPRVSIVSEVLATCDDDFNLLRSVPSPWLALYTAMQHPFVQQHCPDVLAEAREDGYRTAIGVCFGAKNGYYRVTNPEEYDDFIRDLAWRFATLVKSPSTLGRFLAVKLSVAGAIGPLTERGLHRLRALKLGSSISRCQPK